MDITKRRLIQIGVFVGVLLATAGSTSLRAAKPSHVYVLWEGLEPDKCGVAWLVKRFVDPAATFKIVPKGTEVSGGTQLDTPESRIQRTQNQPAFEVALSEYKLDDPALRCMGRIIWDIEINKWEKKVTPESETVAKDIMSIVRSEPDSRKALEKTWGVFDGFYAKMGESK